jgi:hypothetical protein
MTFGSRITRITDKLSFNLLYAPDYPPLHRTSLDREEQLLRQWLSDAITIAKREDVGDWLRLGEQAIVRGFESFRKGDELAGAREIQVASEYLNNAVSKKPFKVDFVARADGTVEQAPEE